MSIDELAGNWEALRLGRGCSALNVSPVLLNSLPMAIYACDAEGRILWFNRHAAEIWGRSPRIADNSEVFCGSYRRYFNGRRISREETPMAAVLRAGEPAHGVECEVERPDGTRILAMFHIEPVEDEDRRLIGAINCFHETTAMRVAADSATRRAEEQTALFEFTDRLQYAVSTKEVYELAMAAIIRAMRCQRAAILLFDAAGLMRFVGSRGLSEIFCCAVEGYSPWTAESEDVQPICINDIDQADLPDALEEALRAEGIRALTFIPLKEEGTIIGQFMAYHDRPRYFTAGEVEAGYTIARQLAFALERRRSTGATLWLATIVETSDDAIISKDLDGTILTWNQGAERIFGYTAEEAIGKPVTILMPPERFNEEPEILARLRRGERIDHYQTVRRRKNGTLIDVSLTVSPVRDRAGRIIGASKIARDISHQKHAEAMLRDNERRLQDLLAAIPAAIYTTDATGSITYYNEAAVEFAGRRPLLGADRWCLSWKLYCPDGTPLPHDQCPMAIALKEGRPVRGKEAVAERPDGTRVPFIPFPTPLRDAEGKVVGAINMLVDISERRQAETQQRLLLRELNHRVKNNMQMLQSLLHAAMRQTRNEEARNVLADATNRIAAMAAAQRTLYNSSDVSRFSADQFLAAICQTSKQAFPSNIKIICESGFGELDTDVAMPLALILNELLINAVKHGCKGDGENIVRVGLTSSDESILYVEDSGPGFDLEAVTRDSSGIKLVQLLARQLRGHLEVTRTPASRCSVRFNRKKM